MRTEANGQQPVWQTLARRRLHSTPWLDLVIDDTLNAAGKAEIYTHVVIPASVTILAHDTDRDLYAVTRQWIYTHGETQWRLPAGGTDRQGTAPYREIAEKELREEVGAVADHWTLLGKVHGADSVSNHADWAWFAEGLDVGEQDLEDGEADLVVHWLPFTTLLELVLCGQMPHAGSVFAVLAVAAHRTIADRAASANGVSSSGGAS